MEIVELRSAAERAEALPILRELYPSLDEGRYASLFAEMEADGYRQFAVRGEDGGLAAVAGVAVHVNLYYGRHLYIYDLVVTEGARSEGYGGLLIDAWKTSPAARGVRDGRAGGRPGARGPGASTSAGGTSGPVTPCARRCAEAASQKAAAFRECQICEVGPSERRQRYR